LAWTHKGMSIDPKDLSLQRLELRLHVLRWKAAIVGSIKRLLPWTAQ